MRQECHLESEVERVAHCVVARALAHCKLLARLGQLEQDLVTMHLGYVHYSPEPAGVRPSGGLVRKDLLQLLLGLLQLR